MISIGDDAQELEEQRKIVGHLGRVQLEAVHAVGEREIDHRLAAIAALAVAVLIEVEREPLGAIEQADPIFLEVHNVAGAKPVDHHSYIREFGWSECALFRQRLLNLVRRSLEFGCRIIE